MPCEVRQNQLDDANRVNAAHEAEFRAIDEILARRPALDDLPNRMAKIQKAITVAREVDKLKRERDDQEVSHMSLVNQISDLGTENMRLRALLIHSVAVLTDTMERFGSMGDEETEMLQWWHDEFKRRSDGEFSTLGSSSDGN
jgi:hypothetical protein